MRRQWQKVVYITLFGTFAAGCGHQADAAEGVDQSWSSICIDQDGDGYGPNCGVGSDCDDNDASQNDSCDACTTPDEGCDCVPGTLPIACTLDRSVTEEGTLLCLSGLRYCRDAAWTECEGVAQYEVPPTDTEWVGERVSAERVPGTASLGCDPCQELWGQREDGP